MKIYEPNKKEEQPGFMYWVNHSKKALQIVMLMSLWAPVCIGILGIVLFIWLEAFLPTLLAIVFSFLSIKRLSKMWYLHKVPMDSSINALVWNRGNK